MNHTGLQFTCGRSRKSSVGGIGYYSTNHYSHMSPMLRTHASSKCGQSMCQIISIFILGDNPLIERVFMRHLKTSYGKRSAQLQSHVIMPTTTKYYVPYLKTRVKKIIPQIGRGQYLDSEGNLSPHQKVMS